MILRTSIIWLCGGLLGCAAPRGPGPGDGTPVRDAAPSSRELRTSPRSLAPSPWSRPVETERGTYRISWRPSGPGVPKNEYFELEVEVTKADERFRGGRLIVDAEMPEHGHGMNVSPRALQRANGRWHVKGMLFHMGGRWVLQLGVLTSGAPEKAYFEIQLP